MKDQTIFSCDRIQTFESLDELVRSNKLKGIREVALVVDRNELENMIYKASMYNELKEEMQGYQINTEIHRLNAKDLQERIDKALKLLDSYKLGKYDYALTCAGLLEFENILRGEDNDK